MKGCNLRHGRMDRYATDVIRVCLEHFNLLACVVVVHTDEHIIRSTNNPLLTGDELSGTHGQLGNLQG